jgi:hypothetical protein
MRDENQSRRSKYSDVMDRMKLVASIKNSALIATPYPFIPASTARLTTPGNEPAEHWPPSFAVARREVADPPTAIGPVNYRVARSSGSAENLSTSDFLHTVFGLITAI